MNDIGLGDNWRYLHYDLPHSQRPLTRRECRDLWYTVAKIRERDKDTEGAKRARFAARCVSGDSRIRHDI